MNSFTKKYLELQEENKNPSLAPSIKKASVTTKNTSSSQTKREEEEQQESKNSFTSRYLELSKKREAGEPADYTRLNQRREETPSYLDMARNATEKNIQVTTSGSLEEMQTRLKELEARQRDLTSYMSGAMRGGINAPQTQKFQEEMSTNDKEIKRLKTEISAAQSGGMVSELDQMKNRLNELKVQEAQARNKAIQYTGSYAGRAAAAANPEAANAIFNEISSISSEREALEKEIERIEYVNKYQDKTYEDKFTGQFGASYTIGRLNQDRALAWNAYLKNPTDANRKKAEAADELIARFQENNAETLDDDATLPWISQSLANYLPQFIDQAKYSAAGAAIGGASGSVVPGIGTGFGIKAGIVAGSGAYSFETMRGIAFGDLLAMGVDEETARAAANDEAIISSLIEMADTGVDIASLGVGKLINAITKGGAKAIAGGAAESAGKKLLKALAGYGLNIGGEMMEEGTQQAVTIANQNRVQNGETGGALSLAGDAARVFKNAVTGGNTEDREEIWEAAKEGGKIAAMMGGSSAISNNLATAAVENYYGKKMSGYGGETVQAIIEEGLASDEKSESYRQAKVLQQKMENGEEITGREIGRLYEQNVRTINDEEAQAKKSQAATTISKPELTSFEKKLQAATGYGEYGARAFSELMDSENMSMQELRTKFQTAYEAGMTNLPQTAVTLTTNIQKRAFNAGKQDYIMSVSRDMEKARYATVYGDESGFIRTDAARDVAQSTIDLMNEVSRDLGIKSRIEETITGLDGREANASMSGDGILSISKTAEKPLVTMVSHESTHRMQQLAPKEYRAFRDFAVQYTGWYEGRLDTGLMTDTATGAKQAAYSQGGTVSSVDYAMDEVTAEFAEKLFSDEQEMADFIREASRTEESRTAVQKFFDIVKDIVKKLKQTASRLTRNGRTEEAALVQESIDGMEKARALWLDAYSAAKQAATEKALNSNPAVSEMAASMKEQAKQFAETPEIRYGDDKKFSMKDSNYMKAVESGDMETAQKMVDEAAKAAGYTVKGFHGTTQRFYVFDINRTSGNNDLGRGHYFTTSEEEGKYYTSTENPDVITKIESFADDAAYDAGYDYENDYDDYMETYNAAYDQEEQRIKDEGRVIQAYIRMNNPFVISDDTTISLDEAIEIAENAYQPLASDFVYAVKRMSKDGLVKTSDIADSNMSIYLSESIMKIGKYDGIIDKTVHDKFGSPSGTHHIIAFESNQIKDASPVTYDDSGKVIPLSERFNDENQDIRFSLKDSTGRSLTKEQAEFFKDSKVRDENGRLIPIDGFYLNLDNKPNNLEFTKRQKYAFDLGKHFSEKYGTEQTDYEWNLFFENEPDIAEKAAFFNSEEQRFFNAGVRGDDPEYKLAIRFGDIPNSGKSKNWATGELERGVSVVDFLNEKTQNGNTVYDVIYGIQGTDKIIVGGWDFGIFGSDGEPLLIAPEFICKSGEINRIKRVTNTNPTSDPDIRFSMKDSEGRDLTVVEDTDGNPVAMTYEDGNARFSLKTYEECGRDYLNEWLDKRVKGEYISREDADSIVSQMDEYYDICKKFTDKYAPFGAWSKAEVVRDSKGKPVFSVVKANGEYAMNLDFSLVCKKRRTLDAVFSEMIDRGILDDADLSEEEISNINSIIRENGFETACALCFVDAKRYRQAKVADSFVDQYNELVKMLLPEDGSVSAHYFDFIGTGNYKNEGAGLHTISDADLKEGIAKLRQVMRDNGSKTVKYKIAKHLLASKSDRKLLTRSEFMNTKGFEAVKTKNPSIMKLYNSSKGSGGPKAAFSDVQYLGDILKKNAWTPEKAYAVGGVRIQSFSDYIPRLVFDYIQMIGDLSAKQLPAHAYTKEAMFAKQFGMTGIKINLSLVPAIAEDGVAPGLDANGDYYWYDGQSFGSDVNVKGSGNTGFELAKQIQNAPGYSANCGTIAVGVSDEHIRKMLDDPDIRMVIPYHKSSLNHIVSVMNNIDAYKDYTDVQNTRDKNTGSKITGKDFNYNEALRRTGDAKTAAAEYLAWCEENGYLPKFDQFADNENYYKLLEDFSTYDNGVAVPQGAVTMTFPKKGDAFGSMSDLIKDGLEEDALLEARRDESIPGIVDQIESVLKKKEKRFSMKETDKLMRENAQLREVVEDLRGQFRTTKFAKVDKKSMDKLTRTLLNDYRSGADINETRDALDSLYTYIANGEDGESPVWSEVFKRAYDAAVSILENVSEVDDELYTQYKGLRDWLRTQPMSINRMYDHDLIGYDSISDFRKANFGRIKITNDGTPVDMVYSELAATYPGFFDESAHVTQPDQLMHIEEVLNRLQPTEFNPYSANMREAATWLANDIIDRFFELPQAKPTYADKAARKLADQKYRDRQKLDRVREQKNERIRQLIAQNREKVKQVQVKERTKRDEAVRQVKEHYKAKEAKASERRQAQLLRAKITRHANDLSAKLLKPTDKQHIPENMRTAVAAVLEAINLESQYTYDLETGKRTKGGDGLPTKRTLAFQKLREQYAEIEGAEGNEMVIDPMMQIMIDRVTEMADVKLADMTVSQLNTIWDVLRVVEHSVNTAGRMLVMDKYARTADWASALVEDTATRRGKKSLTKSHVSIDLEDPYTFFSHYGEAGKSVYRMLRDAQDRQQVMTNKVAEEVSKIVTPKQVKAMEKKIHTFKTVRGDDLILSTAQVMELYNLTKREQARDHLNEGGIVQPEIDSAKIRRGTDSILLADLDLANIIKVLSPEEKTIADKLQGLTVSLLSEYGNEASMKAYGYKKFTEKNYWPIKTAREGRNTGVEKGENNTRSIKNIGMAQSTKPHANNPLDISGIFTTFSNHTADMVDYAAWLCPMEDANRMYNFQFRDINGNRTGKTVKGMLDKYGGEKAQNYWFNLMEDIQNGIKAPGDTSVGNVIAKSIGSFKAAAVGGNLRVVIQQPTAFFRANVVLNPVDLSKGLVSGVTKGNGWEKALKYSPIAMRKDMGGFDISNPMKMSEILFDNRTNIRKLNDALSAPTGKADAVTWGKLWNACEWATAREHKDLTAGSDEFYQTVSELFSEVIDQTQVVDGVLQRSQIMRSSNEVIKQATSFMGEPTKALNILIRSYDAFRYENEPKARSKAMKVLGRSATALVVTAVVNAAAQSIMDALRDDDDEDWKEKFMQAFTGLEGDEESAWDKAVSVVLNGNVGSNLNPVTQIPFAKDALSIIQGYDVSRTEMEIVTDLIEAGQTFIDSVDGQGKRTRKAALAELFSAAAKLYGIPVGNLKRDAWAMLRTFAFETGNIQLQYETDKAIYNLSSTSNKSRFIDILYKAYKEDQDTYEHIYDDLISAGYDADTIKQNMETRMKKDQGVESVSDLEHRYLAPDQQKAYDSKLKELKSNSLWSAASAKDRDTMEDTIFKVVTGDEDTIEAISGGKEYGLDDTEYILYKTAMSMYDQPNANGKYGTYTNKERYDAISAISGLSDFEKAYLWTESSDSTEIYDALGKGINIDVYMEFKGDVDSISADKDSNGKSISGSRKEKIIDYLNAHVGNEKEYWYLLGLEYPSEQKNARYKYFFG